jgi:hypothetical protein
VLDRRPHSRGTVVSPSVGSAYSSGRLGGTGSDPAVTLYRSRVDISTALVETGGLCPVVVQVIITQPGWYSRLDVAFGGSRACAHEIRALRG